MPWLENSGGSEFLNCITASAKLPRKASYLCEKSASKMSSLIFYEKD